MGQLGRLVFRGLKLLVPLLLNSFLLDHDAVPLHQAAQHSLSPVGADIDGDATSMRPTFPGAMVNIAHLQK
jgi:hypothetical protein